MICSQSKARSRKRVAERLNAKITATEKLTIEGQANG